MEDEAAATSRNVVAEVVVDDHVLAAPASDRHQGAVLLNGPHAVVHAVPVGELPERRLGGALVPSRGDGRRPRQQGGYQERAGRQATGPTQWVAHVAPMQQVQTYSSPWSPRKTVPGDHP